MIALESPQTPQPIGQSARLRILWSFARPHWRRLLAGLLLALAGSAMGLATPLVTKWVLDSLESSASLTGPIVALLVLLVLGAGVWLWQSFLLVAVGEEVVFRARESVVQRFLRAKLGSLTQRPPGELVTRVTSDTVLLKEAATSSVVGLLNGAVMLAGTLVLMAVLDLVLFGTTLLSVAVVILIFALLMPAIATAEERAQAHVGHLGGKLEGALRAIRTVKASRAEGREAGRILAHAEDAARLGVRAGRRSTVAWVIAMSGVQFAIILILGIGAWRVSEDAMQVSTLVAFLLYAFGLLGPIMELSMNVTALQSGIAAAGRLHELSSIEVEPQEPTPSMSPIAPAPPAGHAVLTLEGVSAAYGPGLEPAVRDIDLAIPSRGHIAIVGPSGAGKTTLFSLILRFLEPQSGRLLLDGRDYRDYTPGAIRRRLAYVEQETPVLPGTIGENLLFTNPEATDEEMQAVLHEVRLDGLLATLEAGLDTPLTATSVSGGERQRIALARAILANPDVLLLDEATAQVDGLTEAALQQCIRNRAAHGAVVTIAHRLSTVIDADVIIVMEAGRIRSRGSHHELLASDTLYRELVEALRIAADTPPTTEPITIAP